jgi:hypothetical protein
MACPELVDRDELDGYLRVVRPDAPVRLGVLSNPMARRNRLVPVHQHLSGAVADPSDVIETRRAADLRRGLVYLLFHRRANVIAANGGDGTLHAVVNALWALLDELERAFGVEVPPPHMLFLNGGTMNMVSRAMNTRNNALRTVRWFQREYGGGRLADLHVRQQSVLAVERDDTPGADGGRTIGFIFGSELVYNAIWMYDYLGAGYGGLVKMMTHVALGIRFQTALWREYGHLLDPPDSPAWVDGVEHAPYSVVVASTLDMSLLKGVVRTLHVPEGSPGFHAKIILETDKARLVGMIPSLMRERRHPRVLDVPGAQEVRVRGAFTLDGELFPAPIGDPRAVARVRASERRIPAIHNEDGDS